MPIWGVWIDRAFYFSTGRRSRKSKNLSLNPRCVVSLEDASRAVMLEGAAREITKGPTLEKFVIAYKKKYGWDTGETRDPVYQVSPDVIFGIAEDGRTNPTRWQFTAGP